MYCKQTFSQRPNHLLQSQTLSNMLRLLNLRYEIKAPSQKHPRYLACACQLTAKRKRGRPLAAEIPLLNNDARGAEITISRESIRAGQPSPVYSQQACHSSQLKPQVDNHAWNVVPITHRGTRAAVYSAWGKKCDSCGMLNISLVHVSVKLVHMRLKRIFSPY